MPRRLSSAATAVLLTLAAVVVAIAAALAWREVAWRHNFALVKPQAPSPDSAWVAEIRKLPDSPLLAPQSTGVFVAKRWHWLRSVHPELVFAGACDNVDARWMTPRRLVIECELREGEPRLIQALVGDVVIELAIQGRFGLAPPRPRTGFTVRGSAPSAT